MKRLVALVAVASCGGHGARPATVATPQTPTITRTADWLVPLLPEGAQVIVEVDLARLRANAVIGDVARTVLAGLGADSHLPGLPITVQGSPLAAADAVVLGAYGVGTPQASTVLLFATTADVAGAVRVAADIAVLGPDDWVDQIAHRAAIAKLYPDAPAPVGGHATLGLPQELALLRDHAMPTGAPGAVLRVSARLPFDARIAFAQLLGIEAAPARLSIWGDVVDDLAIIIDADTADPGDRDIKGARTRIATGLARVLGAVAAEPAVRAIGVSNNLVNGRLVEQGTWVRTIITVGPRQLSRAADRARKLSGGVTSQP